MFYLVRGIFTTLFASVPSCEIYFSVRLGKATLLSFKDDHV